MIYWLADNDTIGEEIIIEAGTPEQAIAKMREQYGIMDEIDVRKALTPYAAEMSGLDVY